MTLTLLCTILKRIVSTYQDLLVMIQRQPVGSPRTGVLRGQTYMPLHVTTLTLHRQERIKNDPGQTIAGVFYWHHADGRRACHGLQQQQ